MTNKMPVVGKRYVNKKTNKDYELFFTHKEAFYLENTKDDLASVETLVEFWNRFEELPEDNLQEKKEEQEVTLSEFEMLWGKPSYKSGLDLFATSHESASNSTKATAEDISTTELDEVLKEECVEPVSIKKETYRCAHDYVLKNQGYNSIDYLVRQYECSICGENKMTIQS